MHKLLVFQSDWTYKEGAVAATYGVIKNVDLNMDIITATHEIPKFDTWSASYRLYQYIDFWPKGTVFVSVVDPGVGTKRRACVAKTKNGYYIVTPDNGTLTHVKKYFGIEEVREIDETTNRLIREDNTKVAIFQGRDLFGYCGAKLASQQISFEQVGPKYSVEEIICHPIIESRITNNKIVGHFEINDPNFGNLWTNIYLDDFLSFGFRENDLVHTSIYHNDQLVFDDRVPFYSAFGSGIVGQPLIYNNEINKMALACNMDNFCEKYHLSFGSEYRVEFSK